VILARWARGLHRLPAKSLIRPYKIGERARIGSLWLLGLASLVAGVADWLPHAHAYYDTQIFFAAIGAMSGFFVTWCCIAGGMWIKARRAA
jgi:hypothetical protein